MGHNIQFGLYYFNKHHDKKQWVGKSLFQLIVHHEENPGKELR